MSLKLRTFAAAMGVAALFGAVGVDVAQAGTYPKGSTYHSGGEGVTVAPTAGPTTHETMSFVPDIHAEPACGAIAWGGGCG